MKRVIVATIATLAVFSMAFVSCAQKKPAAAPAPTFRIGLVTDIGGIDDKSFNQGTWEGLSVLQKKLVLKKGIISISSPKPKLTIFPTCPPSLMKNWI